MEYRYHNVKASVHESNYSAITNITISHTIYGTSDFKQLLYISACGDLSLVNGQVSVTEIVFRSEANFVCDTGYFLDGPSSVTCLQTGSWGPNLPVCRIHGKSF